MTPTHPPLSVASFYILLSLAPGAKHGYAILKDVEDLSQGTIHLSTSTLYDALERMLTQGMIERIEEAGSEKTGRPRKIFRINRLGKDMLAAEILHMQSLLELARLRLKESPG